MSSINTSDPILSTSPPIIVLSNNSPFDWRTPLIIMAFVVIFAIFILLYRYISTMNDRDRDRDHHVLPLAFRTPRTLSKALTGPEPLYFTARLFARQHRAGDGRSSVYLVEAHPALVRETRTISPSAAAASPSWIDRPLTEPPATYQQEKA